MTEVKLVAITKPVVEGINTAEEFVAYAARVSNPGAQINNETAPKLLKYLVRNKHWSPFEMVQVVMEVVTTRDIGRQLIRHRSFSFQEFSQRYAEVDVNNLVSREARLQDRRNRQNSIEVDDPKMNEFWAALEKGVANLCIESYKLAIDAGIAKEQARALLPEGLTPSTLYVSGSLRSWIHYCQLRGGNGTQKEHREIAMKAWDIILKEFPSLSEVLSEQ